MKRTGSTSLVDVLGQRADELPRKRAYTFLADGEVESAHLTYRELDRHARAIGALLTDSGLAGERVVLLYPPGLDFVAAFFGCLYGGAVAIPAYPPRAKRSWSRLIAILRDARPAAALSPKSATARLTALKSQLPELARIRLLAADAAADDPAAAWTPPRLDREALALLQYTSGSTSRPRGVEVTHGHLMHNEEMIRRAFRQSEESVVVGWLPVYHDMGLIGNVLQPCYVGAHAILMSPTAFLQQPRRWLEAISCHRATTSGGPNFAYELCVRRIRDEERGDLDLSSWTVAFNGSEPVRAATMEAFARTFAPCGFRRRAFSACYGLAEATLFVTGSATPGARTASFDAAALERHRVVPAPPDDGRGTPRGISRRELVGCGRAWMGQEVAIVAPQDRRRRAPDVVGEIWLRGGSVARGYWHRPEDSVRTFGARLADSTDSGMYLRTGDLGFLHDGELYITGRLKDLIILRGRNHYPQDIEQTAEQAHAALRPGCGAAFSVEAESAERLVIVWEYERRSGAPVDEVMGAVRQAVAEAHEVSLHEVVLLRPGTIPKTSSGKIQRHLCRAGYLTEELVVVVRSGVDVGQEDEPPAPVAGVDRETLAGLQPEEKRSALLDVLRRETARVTRTAAARIAADDSPTRHGLDSLAAVELKQALATQLGVEVPLADLVEGVSLAELASRWLDSPRRYGRRSAFPKPAPPVDVFPLSYGQRALWFLQRLAPDSRAYYIAAAARVRPALNRDALRRALGDLVERHAALRTTFHAADGEPYQRLQPAPPPGFVEEDATALSRRELQRRLLREAYHPFDLEAGPLFRVAVFRCAGAEDVVLISMHHIVTDFWSLSVLTRDLGILYGRRSGSLAGELVMDPLAAAYSDYVAWQEELLAGERGEALWKYWQAQLASPLPVLELPTDRPRPAVQTYRGATETLSLGPELSEALAALAHRRGSTLFMVLLAAFQALLHRWSGQVELMVGSPAAGRSRSELAGLVGYFTGPVVLRADFSDRPSFEGLADRARQRVLGALAHQDYPFPLLAERLQPDRDPGRSPIFQAMFVLQKAPRSDLPRSAAQSLAAFALRENGGQLRLGELTLESVKLPERASQFDLTLHMAELEGRLVAVLQYNTDLFDSTTPRRWLGHLRGLLADATADPARSIASLALLTAIEAFQLLAEWNDTPAVAARELCLHELFEAQAARTPKAVALAAAPGEPPLTYRELNVRANRLAHALRRRGVGPEVRVGVCLERSPDMVIALMAVLKAGGAYVPLDPGYPRERLAFMLEDSGAAVLLGRRSLAEAGWPAEHLVLYDPADGAVARESAANPACLSSPRNLAYVIYTSGSTGRPKGVAIEHRSPVALVCWARDVFSAEELAGILAATSISFDLSVFEIFVALAWGGKVVLAEHALALISHPAFEEVTLINTVPSAMAELAQGRLPSALVTVNLAGEALRPRLVRRIFKRHGQVERVLNLYGPSEDTTYSTFVRLGAESLKVTIGRPVANGRVYLTDRDLRIVPVGVVAEICLSGAGLARGYLDRPALTAETFVPDPFIAGPGGRLYATGDLARYLPAGELDFLGRIDHQVKLRGFRIELGEIEATLAMLTHVAEAAVVARSDPAGLAAYVAPVEGSRPTASHLKTLLAAKLPEYMVPSLVVLLDELPRTPNGKVDRNELVRRAAADPTSGTAYVASRTPAEELMVEIFSELLRARRVGAHDHFFERGGHSLLATQLISRVRQVFAVELPLRTVFEAPTVAGLALRVEQEIRAGEIALLPPIEPATWPRDRPQRPLSFAQERLWFLDQMAPASPAYNLPLLLRLRGTLDVPALAAAVGEIERRHEVLRATFAAVDGKPRQTIGKCREGRLPIADLRGLPELRRRSEAGRLARQEAAQAFDLTRGPMLRTALVRTGDGLHELLVTQHHIVSDGWSTGLWLRELGLLYRALAGRRSPGGEQVGSPLPELEVQYVDFVLWQRKWLSGTLLARELAYWKARLGSGPRVLELPTDRPRPAVRTYRGASRSLQLSEDLVRDLETSSRRQQTTLFMMLLAAFQTILGRFSGQTDVAVGTPIAGRVHLRTENLIGLFVNTLVLRTDLSGEPSYAALLKRVREVTLGAYAHQHLPFEKLVEELQPERDLSRTPLFQAMFALQNVPLGGLWEDLAIPGLEVEPVPLDNRTAKFDLTLFLEEPRPGLAGKVTYNRDLFDATTVERLMGQFRALLQATGAGIETRLTELATVSAAERHEILVEWNATATAYAAHSCLHELFEAQAGRTPTAPAVVSAGESLTYGELNARSNRLAHYMRHLGLRPEAPVAVCLDRSAELVVALLAVLKAGGAYLPLEPSDPRERLRYIVADARSPLVVSAERLDLALEDGDSNLRVVRTDRDAEAISQGSSANPKAGVSAGHLAYLLYTSGSTGRPKGVLVEHRSVVNYLSWVEAELLAGRVRSLPLVSRASFDASLKQLFSPLLRGATVRILPRETVSRPVALLEALDEANEEGFNCVPSLWEAMVTAVESGKADVPEPLRHLYTGGEELPEALVKRTRALFPGLEIINLYGPTEATANVSWSRVGGGRSTLGRPLANHRLRVLDPDLRLAAIGIPGELYVSGAGVARGYLGRPALTAASFLPDLFAVVPGARIYRTGDRVRYLPDGALEFLGRADRQVKLRGFRIELGEIEAVLGEHPLVRETAVLARDAEPGGQLVAYVVGRGDAATETASRRLSEPIVDQLRRALRARLPDYMVPAAFVGLDMLPRTASGKPDLAALAAPTDVRSERQEPGDGPRNPVEEVLAGLMAEVLGVEQVGIDDNFFELGGHSLLATELVSLIQDTFEVELPLLQLFDAATVADLAHCLLEDPLQREKVEAAAPVVLRLAAESAPADEDAASTF